MTVFILFLWVVDEERTGPGEHVVDLLDADVVVMPALDVAFTLLQLLLGLAQGAPGQLLSLLQSIHPAQNFCLSRFLCFLKNAQKICAFLKTFNAPYPFFCNFYSNYFFELKFLKYKRVSTFLISLSIIISETTSERSFVFSLIASSNS